ncbi:hypothetical protein B0H13DRAFT_2512022 [Mycena leptocephala]|nr:hypothetical protein B0H13DRAFT_2512022 [Mycena leptocephala]
MTPAILNLSLDHHARDTQYPTPQTNISSTSHSTESVETYGQVRLSGFCFHFVPAAFSLGAPVINLTVPVSGRVRSLVLRAMRNRASRHVQEGAPLSARFLSTVAVAQRITQTSTSTLANRYTALPNPTRRLRHLTLLINLPGALTLTFLFAKALHGYTASICLSNAKRRLASTRVLDLGIPPGPPKRFGSRIATNTARHDTVDIPGRAQHTQATIRCSPAVVQWPSPLDHRVLIDAPRDPPTITPPPMFKSRSLHASGRHLRSIRAPPPALSQRPYAQRGNGWGGGHPGYYMGRGNAIFLN